MDRRNTDRRKGDRRQTQPPQKKFHLLFVFLLGLAFAYSAYIALFGLFPQQSSLVEADFESKTYTQSQVRNNYEAYRQSVLDNDKDLLAAYRKKKEDRRAESRHQNNSTEYYEKQIARIEQDMESELIRKTPMKEGSLSWGLQQDLEKIKSDAPPQ